ncbi:MAG: hypothetical protein IT285_11725, partial [Bdellovibrionales bacterium]|nr:hypothetical protein [Bdellovibrionales bacterium]
MSRLGGMRATFVVFSFGAALISALGPTPARADLDCLRAIPGNRVFEFDGPTWVSSGLNRAETVCDSCPAGPTVTAAARAACMRAAVTAAGDDSLRGRYASELRRWADSSLRESSPSGPAPTAAQITARLNEVVAACPQIGWDQMMAGNSQTYHAWREARRCAARAACTSVAADRSAACESGAASATLTLETLALSAFQVRAAEEALTDGHSAPEVLTFDEEEEGSIEVSPPPREPSGPLANRTRGISRANFLGQSELADARTGQVETAELAATRERMGCPSNAEYSLPDGSSICVRSGLDGIPDRVLRTMDDVSAAVSELVYRDLAAFAAERVWQSYTVALLMDENVTGGGCASQAAVLQSVRQHIGGDAYMGADRNPDEGLRALGSCFGPQSAGGLGLGSRIQDLAATARNVRCRLPGDARATDGACDAESERMDGGEARRRQLEAFRRRVNDLALLRDRRAEFRRGAFRVGGRALRCGSYGTNCGAFIDWMESCRGNGYRLVSGCIPPDSLTEEMATAWQAWENLGETENYILSRYPELAVPTVVVEGSSERRVPAWEATHLRTVAPRDSHGRCPVATLGGGSERRSCDHLAEEYFDVSLRESRRQKLDLILNEACDDPAEFSKQMLLTNPELVNAFLDQADSPDMGTLLCAGLAEAQSDSRAEAWMRMGATGLTMAVGMASAIPTG